MGMRIPEASSPGDRSLTTFLLGVEFVGPHEPRGPFAFLGAGVGHYTLSHALGVFEPPYGDRWLIPPRNLTSFAVGGGLGYRSRGGRPIGLQVSLRVHALVHGGEVPASAYATTLGIVY
jgi:hypothetical protein